MWKSLPLAEDGSVDAVVAWTCSRPRPSQHGLVIAAVRGGRRSLGTLRRVLLRGIVCRDAARAPTDGRARRLLDENSLESPNGTGKTSACSGRCRWVHGCAPSSARGRMAATRGTVGPERPRRRGARRLPGLEPGGCCDHKFKDAQDTFPPTAPPQRKVRGSPDPLDRRFAVVSMVFAAGAGAGAAGAGRASEKPLATVLPPNRARSNAFCLLDRVPGRCAASVARLCSSRRPQGTARKGAFFAAAQSSISRQHRPRRYQGPWRGAARFLKPRRSPIMPL